MTAITTINQKHLVPELHIASGNRLGECVRYDCASQSLHWVDILGSSIHVMTGDHKRSLDLPIQPGFVGLLETGEVFTGGDQQMLQPAQGSFNAVPVPDCKPGEVVNDGVVSPDGRCLVFTSRDEKEEQPVGRMMVLIDSELLIYPHRFTSLNGPAFSPCGRIIYFTDSVTGEIWQATIDTSSGKVGEHLLFATVSSELGLPDGMCTDDEGCLWSAHWDGARLTRYKPDGSVDLVVPLPVTRPTSVWFGGESRNTLYITSAMPDDLLHRPPVDGLTDGDLLSMVTPVTGPANPRLQFNPLEAISNGVITRIS